MIVIVSENSYIEEALLQFPQIKKCGIETKAFLPENHNYKLVINDDEESVGINLTTCDFKQSIIKTFHIDELISVVKEALKTFYVKQFSWQSFSFDKNKRELFMANNKLSLTEKETEIIYYLLINNPKALSKEELLQKVWGYDVESGSNTLDTHIYSLKNKLKNSFEVDFIVINKGNYSINKNA